MQGFMLGGLLNGIHVQERQFAGGAFDWLTPFSLMCGVGLVIGYALLGACWLAMKTTGSLEQRARRLSTPLLAGLVVLIIVVSVWTPLEHPFVANRWFRMPNFLYLSPVPAITAALVFLCWRGMRSGHDTQGFWSAVSLFVVSFIGLIISMYPFLVPPAISFKDAAGAPDSQIFILVGTCVLLPFILGYTVFVYHTFRGKLQEGEGYH
jgi:cytochrome d ubiquinol oxidase subunit II